MGIFSSLYNKVAKFFRPQEEGEEASKSVATNRLKLVLMQDRTNLTPKILEQRRSELIDLLSRYVELDKELLELNFEQEGDQVALMLSIPVIRAKDEEEIEAILAAEAELKAGVNDSVDDDSEAEEDEEFEDEELVEEEIESAEVEAEITSETTETTSQTPSKPKKRRRKLEKVSSPEGLNSEEKTEEVEETVTETTEG